MTTARGVEDAAYGRRIRILFFLRALNFDRVFEGFLRELLRRGHTIHVALEAEKRVLPQGAGLVFQALTNEYSAFSYELLPRRTDRWLPSATTVRCAIDYLRYLKPEYAEADALRDRARARAPRAVPFVLERLRLRRTRAFPWIERTLRSVERRIPVPSQLIEYVRGVAPDVVLVAPLVGLGSAQGDYIRAASHLGLPSVLVVASWDNLTNKGVIRDAPTATIVWNEAQVEEAVRLHGLPAASVSATGAHAFDHWFGWTPSTTREEFAEKVGLDASRPFLLYVCSSGFIAGAESAFIAEWLRQLRTSLTSTLREIGVVIRPHPQNVRFWETQRISEEGKTVVWPIGGAAPTDDRRKADYFDSLYHSSGVIGINTSALIEAAIVGRPVFTVLSDRFRQTQEGTLHFEHLTGGDDEEGLLVVARSWEEHLSHLAAAVADPDFHRDAIDRFLLRFVRPHGLDKPAAPQAAQVVETTARARVTPLPISRPSLSTELLVWLDHALRFASLATLAVARGRRGGGVMATVLREPRHRVGERTRHVLLHVALLLPKRVRTTLAQALLGRQLAVDADAARRSNVRTSA